MRMPLNYSLRSLLARPGRSLLTVLGVGISIFLSVMMLGLSKGLLATTLVSGDELNVIALSKGAEALEFSAIDTAAFNILATAPGIAVADGRPQASPEAYLNSLVTVAGSRIEPQPVLVRGLLDELGFSLHRQVELTEGTWPARGYQVAVGPLVATRLGLPGDGLKIGQYLEFEGRRWEITGLLAAPGTVFEAEIWTRTDDLMVAGRHDDYSSIVFRAVDLQTRDDLLFDLRTRTDARTTPLVERDYYSAGASQVRPVQAVVWIMTVLLICGGLMAGMNTMLNSILGRTREMAVLLVLGYRRSGVLLGFVLEGIVLCLAGGVIGGLPGWLLNGLPMKFSMGAFRFQVDGAVILAGLGLALLIGLLGSVIPVARIARMKSVEGLRQ